MSINVPNPSRSENDYVVRWEINVMARNAEEAARKALGIQRDPESIGTVFDVAREGVKEGFEMIEIEPAAPAYVVMLKNGDVLPGVLKDLKEAEWTAGKFGGKVAFLVAKE